MPSHLPPTPPCKAMWTREMESKKRQELRAELTAQGYAWNYIDSWPPKTSLYVHRPMVNPEGLVVNDRGVIIPNVPGHPDYVARKSRIGLLPWPPGEGCACKACREHDWHPAQAAVAVMEAPVEAPIEATVEPMTEATQEVAVHAHRYKSQHIGSPCTVAGCTATRIRRFGGKKR